MVVRTAFFSLLILLTASGAPAAVQKTDLKSFPAGPEDTLIIENDYGRVQIQIWDHPQVEVRTRVVALDSHQLDNATVVVQRVADRIYVRSYFYDYQAESVYLQVLVPPVMSVVVWGANPAVEIQGTQGYVRVYTFTGLITAENLSGPTSLATENGDILFRSMIQPSSDIRLESLRGAIQCELGQALGLRTWLRAGKILSWNGEIELSKGHLEKQVGNGGPLLYASSLSGDVRLRFESENQSSSTLMDPAFEDDRPETPAVTTSGGVTPDSGHSQAPGGYSLKVNVDWIHLNVSVRDSYTNRAVAHLNQEDFLVYEDGVLQNLERFVNSQAPFYLLLLLDVSGSTRSYIDLIKEASVHFSQQIKASDQMALAVFNSQTSLVQEFTNDRDEIQRAIRRVRSGGGTAFYDALHQSITEYMEGLEGRKAIVVFSDGVDNQLTGDYSNGSQITFRDLFREIQEIDTLIYTIFLDTEESVYGGSPRQGGRVGSILIDILSGRTPPFSPRGGHPDRAAYEEARSQLELIADQTGARMYAPRKIEDLSRVYTEIASDLRVQYSLGYHSSNPAQDGRWRTIEVKIRNHPDLMVRSRKGYYAGGRNQS